MKSAFSSQILLHSLRWIFKLGLLNAINLGLACLLVLARLAFEQIPLSEFQFPFYLFLTGLVLMNWVYNLGLVYANGRGVAFVSVGPPALWRVIA